jgi:hypothetical protein
MTVLLVLAIAASSALVFTDRVELLKLAVILALWAAVVAAFVSVIHRRQSDIDRARARDLKLVYDLQLDREISARREYELEVESQLRRELASELRGQATDEVAALRAELAALRNNLEILFDADLSHRPAIENERAAPIRAYSDWQRDVRPPEPNRVSASRFTNATPRNDVDDRDAENAIIDVPEEPPVVEEPPRPEPQPYFPPPPQPEPMVRRHAREDGGYPPPPPPPDGRQWQPAPAQGQWRPAGTPGSNWVPSNGSSVPPPAPAPSQPHPGRHSTPGEQIGAPANVGPSARHSSEFAHSEPPPAAGPHDSAAQPEQPTDAQHSEGQGQPVAELLARFQSGAGPMMGGRRRRRDG